MTEHTYSDYWNAVTGFALDAIEAAAERDNDQAFDEYLDDWVSELVARSYWVVYTHAAMKVMQYTDNANAFFDYSESVGEKDWSSLVSQFAYCAHEQDILDRVARELKNEERKMA